MSDHLEFEFGLHLVEVHQAVRVLGTPKKVLDQAIAIGALPVHIGADGHRRVLIEDALRVIDCDQWSRFRE